MAAILDFLGLPTYNFEFLKSIAYIIDFVVDI